jgi:hypothetical protein
MVVAAGAEYDVVVEPEGGKDVTVAEKVRPRAGELLVLDGNAGRK